MRINCFFVLIDSFDFQKFDALLTLIRRNELSTNEVNKCRECIYALMTYKDSKEPLTSKSVDCVKFKNPLSR